MGWTLRANVSFCISGERACFLDLDADRYFALGTIADEAFRKLINGQQLNRWQSEALAPHIGSGLLQMCAGDTLPAPCPTAQAPTSDRHAITGIRTNPLTLARSGAQIFTAERQLRTRPLGEILAEISDTRGSSEVLSAQDIEQRISSVCRAFECWDLLSSPLDRCLPRSIAMMRMLAPCRPQLVLGVMSRPFRAHCWVQLGGLVLNDALAHVSAFTPIRII